PLGPGPQEPWVQRYHLSRLQAQVAALNLASGADDDPPLPGRSTGPHDWLDELEHRRGELADLADERMAAIPPPGRRRARTGSVSAGFDEIGEQNAFLQHMPPLRAVDRLERGREDRDR